MSISRWARRKVASGKPYLQMCVAAGRKTLVYAWHNMMGHPAPDREGERMFRTKVIAIHKELGEDAAGITGFRKSSEYAKAVMTPLYAHLSA